MKQIIECVPNFSEGKNPEIINAIAEAIKNAGDAKLLHVDPGKATNRTVMTIAGTAADVIEAAFQGIKAAAELIDMARHTGEHPRMGATDVCPLIPIQGISLEETAEWAHKLAKRVGEQLGIPVYTYEAAAKHPLRKNLAVIREDEYEGLEAKMKQENWQPDYGPTEFNPKSGATVIGARNFLIAYNINLNTKSVRLANAIAFDLREQGRVKRTTADPASEILRDEEGNPLRQPGLLKGVKAIGWYIEEYGIAQVSMNITDIGATPLHVAFDTAVEAAAKRGVRVTGSELIGLVPLSAMVEAGKHYLKKQRRSAGIPNKEIAEIAAKTFGLSELGPFKLEERVIEYKLAESENDRLAQSTVAAFGEITASESAAPGGGSVAALCGMLGASLAAMVANLSANKRGWEEKVDFYSTIAQASETLRMELLGLIDEDTQSFDAVMSAFSLPKATESEAAHRANAIKQASQGAADVPLRTIRAAAATLPLLGEMAGKGNPNSITDVGVGALCAQAAIQGALLNVMINLKGDESAEAIKISGEARKLAEQSEVQIAEILALVNSKI